MGLALNGIGVKCMPYSVLPYSVRLRELGLTTLAERRVRGDLIDTNKIINGHVSYGKSLFNVGRAGMNLLSKPRCDITMKCTSSFISERVVKFWNKLPQYCKSSNTVNVFKSNLDFYHQNHEIQTSLRHHH